MNNTELKIKFDKVQQNIEAAKAKGENPTPFMKEKIELLQIGYQKLSEQLKADKFEKNPKKYSTLLQYLNNIKSIQSELHIPSTDTENEIRSVHSQMDKAGLGWLIRK